MGSDVYPRECLTAAAVCVEGIIQCAPPFKKKSPKKVRLALSLKIRNSVKQRQLKLGETTTNKNMRKSRLRCPPNISAPTRASLWGVGAARGKGTWGCQYVGTGADLQCSQCGAFFQQRGGRVGPRLSALGYAAMSCVHEVYVRRKVTHSFHIVCFSP